MIERCSIEFFVIQKCFCLPEYYSSVYLVLVLYYNCPYIFCVQCSGTAGRYSNSVDRIIPEERRQGLRSNNRNRVVYTVRTDSILYLYASTLVLNTVYRITLPRTAVNCIVHMQSHSIRF